LRKACQFPCREFASSKNRSFHLLGSCLTIPARYPHLVHSVGDLSIKVEATNALLERAGRFVDAAVGNPTEQSVAEASIAVAEAKALSTEVSLHVSNKLFELTGSRSTLQEFGLDRHWRNARTHTLHDPVRWKYHRIGDFVLNGVKPPRHGAL
jgi:alkylation response protein AidB-like acyl-CoA dehydrogenase